MPTYPFLSDEWFVHVERIVEEHGAEIPDHADLVMNLVVTDTPFGAERELHVGARHGQGRWGEGHEPDADLTVTTDYETARDILLSGDPQAGLNAFLTGKVRIQGDLAKLLTTAASAQSAQSAEGAEGAVAPVGAAVLAEAVLAITE